MEDEGEFAGGSLSSRGLCGEASGGVAGWEFVLIRRCTGSMKSAVCCWDFQWYLR